LGARTWRAPTSEVWQARRAAVFLRDMNERVEEAEIFQQEMRNIVSYSQAEALMNQDRALENRTRWQYDLADRNAHLQFRQSMMALLGAQLGFTPESLLRMQAFNSLRNPFLPFGIPPPTVVPGLPLGAPPPPFNVMMPGLPGIGGMPQGTFSMPNMMNPLTNPAALAMGRGIFPGGVQPVYGSGNNAVTFMPPGVGGYGAGGGYPLGAGPGGFPGGLGGFGGGVGGGFGGGMGGGFGGGGLGGGAPLVY